MTLSYTASSKIGPLIHRNTDCVAPNTLFGRGSSRIHHWYASFGQLRNRFNFMWCLRTPTGEPRYENTPANFSATKTTCWFPILSCVTHRIFDWILVANVKEFMTGNECVTFHVVVVNLDTVWVRFSSIIIHSLNLDMAIADKFYDFTSITYVQKINYWL